MSQGSDWLTSRQDGVRLSVKVRPRAARAAIQGVEVEGERAHLVVKVAAPPEGGKANAATVSLRPLSDVQTARLVGLLLEQSVIDAAVQSARPAAALPGLRRSGFWRKAAASPPARSPW